MLIGVLKLMKGLLLLAVGIGLLSLLNGDITEKVKHWAHLLQFDLDGRFMQKVLAKLVDVDKKDIRLVAGTTIVYAGLMLTEGIGLWYEKVWAEYMTFIMTAAFIPYEANKFVVHPTKGLFLLIILNSLIAAYLAVRLHQREMSKRKEAALQPAT